LLRRRERFGAGQDLSLSVQDDPLHGRPECTDTKDGKPFVPLAASGMMKAKRVGFLAYSIYWEVTGFLGKQSATGVA
jgi:hypothetical protein